jgi:16S rRNA pseudouridine516 synthase
MGIERLDKALCGQGLGTRKEIHEAVRAGLVAVNGIRAIHPGQKINTQSDQVTMNSKPIPLCDVVMIMLNKPAGVLSATRDPNAPTVLDLLPEPLRRRALFPVGRLDKDTTGLLLLTDDGELAHRLLSPRHHVQKTYLATLESPATEADRQAFAAGMNLVPTEGHPPETCAPAALEILENNRAIVTLTEGKYHQIKRMFAAQGNKVLALQRLSMHTIHLDPALCSGAWRELTADEIAALRNA